MLWLTKSKTGILLAKKKANELLNTIDENIYIFLKYVPSCNHWIFSLSLALVEVCQLKYVKIKKINNSRSPADSNFLRLKECPENIPLKCQ